MKQKKNSNQPKLNIVQRIDSSLLKAAVFISKISAFFSSASKLHNARFAAIHELDTLLESAPDHATSLLLARGRAGHVLAVRPQRTRTELGNLLVVAPTRGGKGL
jgi:hypothetical protein